MVNLISGFILFLMSVLGLVLRSSLIFGDFVDLCGGA